MALHPNELDQQIENLRTLQQSYDQIAGAAEAYNTGKVELAKNITAKGVPAAATETLPELADKVRDIQQTTTVIDGGGMYAAQLFGDANAAVSPLWNLYDVLAQMKSQWMGAGQYACLIVCEYYKGYDSLQLQGADAYYTCDGAFYDYDALHVWTDAENGKANRWVCFLYQQEGARLDITNTAISPRSMYIGGHIGTIEYFVNGRLTELVCGVEDTDVVDNLAIEQYTQAWGRNFIVRNFGVTTNNFFAISGNSQNVLLETKKNFVLQLQAVSNVYKITIPNGVETFSIRNIKRIEFFGSNVGARFINIGGSQTIIEISMPDTEEIISHTTSDVFIGIYLTGDVLKRLDFRSLKNVSFRILNSGAPTALLSDVLVGEFYVNLDIRGWNPTNVLADADKKAQLIDNIKNHILARVSDATGGTQLVFTISTNMYNAIASETITWNDQTMTLADAFLTKNWLLAGA